MPHYRRGSPIDAREVSRILAACARDRSPVGTRDVAMIALLCGFGLRPDDICALNWEHYRAERNALVLPDPEAPVARVVQLSANTAASVAEWVAVRNSHPGSLFHPIRRPDHILKRRLLREALNRVLGERAREAGVVPFSPDDVTRTHTALCCGQWKSQCCCPLPMGMDLMPIWPRAGRLKSVSESRVAVEPMLDRASQGEPSAARRAVVRYLSRLSSPEKTQMREALDQLAATLVETADALTFPWLQLRPQNLPPPKALAEKLGHRLRRVKTALNGLFREASGMGLVTTNLYYSIRDICWNRAARPKAARMPTGWQEIQAILTACLVERGSIAAKRDAGLIALMWLQQIDTKEVIAFPYGAVFAPFRVSRSQRPAPPMLQEALERWCMVRGDAPGWLMHSISRSGEIVREPMTITAVRFALERRCREAGVANISAGDVRLASIRYHW